MSQRRRNREGLGALLREVSHLKRVRKCGHPAGAGAVAIKLTPDGAAFASGIQTCGSIWSCPTCAAKIRARRADEITMAVRSFAVKFDAGIVAFGTFTLRHRKTDRLGRLLDLKAKALKRVFSGRAWQEERARYGIIGSITSDEITRTYENGWHPHRHGLWFFTRKLSEDERMALQAAWQSRWDRALVSLGLPKTVAGIGVDLRPVVSTAEVLAQYLAKCQEYAKIPAKRPKLNLPQLGPGESWDHGAAAELARGDLKDPDAKRGSRTPFQILADFGSDGDESDLKLWHEFERETKGRSAIRWSRGLRELLEVEDEETDEEVAAAEVEGSDVALIEPGPYRTILHLPCGRSDLYAAAEAGGSDGIRRYFRALGLDPAAVHEPNPSKGMDH